MPSGLLLLVLGVGLADSINPVPFAIAVLQASRSLRCVVLYVTSGFVVTLAAGLVMLAGPGTALHSLVARASPTLVHTGEIVGGAVAVVVGIGLFVHHARDSNPDAEAKKFEDRSPVVLGAMIAALDLPTAFPYLGVIVAVISAQIATTERVGLIVIYNVCYALPLIAVVTIRAIAGERAKKPLAAVRQAVERWGSRVFGAIAILVGVLFLYRGISRI
jgi:cytochrome c biogenesis protein CcdA